MSLETTKGYPPQGENYEEWRNVGKIGWIIKREQFFYAPGMNKEPRRECWKIQSP
jgi:hypothetical protein